MADRLRVVDASPLIVLAKVDRLDLLGRRVLVPQSVADELLAGPAEDPARAALTSGRFGSCPSVDVPPVVQEWGLGAGESAVLALALDKPGCEAILDDAQGRRCARAVGVPVLGSLGLVVRAARSGLLPSASAVLHELRSVGLWLDDALVRSVLRDALDEDWTPR